jgi:hypothetical protein
MQTNITDLPILTSLSGTTYFPVEDTNNNETKAVSFTTLLANVPPRTKLYLNGVLDGTYGAINVVAGNNINVSTTDSGVYRTLLISSTIPNPLTITNVGSGASLYKNYSGGTYNLKTIVAGTNIGISSDVNTITISNTAPGEANTASSVGTGIAIYKEKVGADLRFKSLVAGNNITLDTTNSNQIVINASAGINTVVGQNVGVGTGRIYVNNVASTLRFKSIKAGTNILISDSASEITISAVGTGNGVGLTNANDVGSTLYNGLGQIKRISAGSGVTITDSETSLTIASTSTNQLSNIGTGRPIYKSFNAVTDKYELRTLRGLDGITVESNDTEVLIRGNSSTVIASTGTTNSLIASQANNVTTLKVINVANTNVATIQNNTNNLTLTILNDANFWNANRLNGIPITIDSQVPDQESTLVYRGTDYVPGTPNNLVPRFLTAQGFGQVIPVNGQVFIPVQANTWAPITVSHNQPLLNFFAIYVDGNLYTNNSLVNAFTSLVPGSLYYINNSNTSITTTAGLLVAGIALNSTTLWFKPYVA